MREMAGRCSICVHGDTCYGDECHFRRKKEFIDKEKSVSKIKGDIHINKSGRMSWGVEHE